MNYLNRSDIKNYFMRRTRISGLSGLGPPNSNDAAGLFLFMTAQGIPTRVITQNFAKVQLYFESMSALTVSDVPAVGDFEFASELGELNESKGGNVRVVPFNIFDHLRQIEISFQMDAL